MLGRELLGVIGTGVWVIVFEMVVCVFVKGCGYVRGTDGVVCLGPGCVVGLQVCL